MPAFLLCDWLGSWARRGINVCSHQWSNEKVYTLLPPIHCRDKTAPLLPAHFFLKYSLGVTQVDLELKTLQTQSHNPWSAVITGVSHHTWPNLPKGQFLLPVQNLSLVHRPSHIKYRLFSFNFKAFYSPALLAPPILIIIILATYTPVLCTPCIRGLYSPQASPNEMQLTLQSWHIYCGPVSDSSTLHWLHSSCSAHSPTSDYSSLATLLQCSQFNTYTRSPSILRNILSLSLWHLSQWHTQWVTNPLKGEGPQKKRTKQLMSNQMYLFGAGISNPKKICNIKF